MDTSLERYSRQIYFNDIGEEGQKKLLTSRVAIIGCGALGTVMANGLARGGIGHLRIIDRDFIEESNLQRQVLFDEEDLRAGLPKAEAARRKLRRINSTITIEGVVTDINYTNVVDLIASADVVLDASDNFETRFLVNEACIKSGIPWIYGACMGSTGLTMNILPGKTPCLRCVFESAPPPEMSLSCDTAGVLSGIVNAIASIQVTEAFKLLVGRLDKLRRDLLCVDIWACTFKRFGIGHAPHEHCPTCGLKTFEFLEARLGSHTTTLCGRNAVQVMQKDKVHVHFDDLANKLRKLGPVTYNKFMLKFEYDGYSFTVFSDGRAIIQGTHDVVVARNLYAKYIGA